MEGLTVPEFLLAPYRKADGELDYERIAREIGSPTDDDGGCNCGCGGYRW